MKLFKIIRTKITKALSQLCLVVERYQYFGELLALLLIFQCYIVLSFQSHANQAISLSTENPGVSRTGEKGTLQLLMPLTSIMLLLLVGNTVDQSSPLGLSNFRS